VNVDEENGGGNESFYRKIVNYIQQTCCMLPYMQARCRYLMVSAVCKGLSSMPAWILSRPGLDLVKHDNVSLETPQILKHSITTEPSSGSHTARTTGNLGNKKTDV
jgi:hypothetical protein